MTLISRTPEIAAEDILSCIGNAVFVVNADDCVTYANDHLSELTGISRDELIGRPYSFLLSQIAAQSDDSRQTLKRLLAALDRVGHFPLEKVALSKPSPRHLQIALFPLAGNNGDGVWGGAIQDISSDQERSAHRTKVFLNLIDELRSSLVFIIGYTSTMLSDQHTWNQEELDGFLHTINTNAKDTIQLLENVRDISRLELNELELRARPTNLKRLVQYVTQKLGEETDYLDIALDIADKLPMVDLDVIRFSRGLRNLLASILKLSFDSKIQLSAHQDDSKVQIDIVYHGMSLPDQLREEDLDQVLQDRSYNSQMTRDLGLRLYVAQGIVRIHEGRLWTETSKDQKVAVHITLPLTHRMTAASHPELQTSQNADPQAKPAKPNAKVLVVEHDTRVCHHLKAQLGLEGYQVVCAHEGATALELAAIEVPDIILLSYHLPDSDGLTICRELREYTAMPIIMLASSSEEDTIIESLNAGADDYLAKPPRTKELLARIQANLRRTFLSDNPDKSSGKTSFKAGNLVIDFVQRKVTRNGETVDLTPIEYKLLYNLAVNAGRILTHEQLVSKVWGPMFRQETQYLWVNISRLRAKIEDDPSKPQFVLTERGVGYSFYNPDSDNHSDMN